MRYTLLFLFTLLFLSCNQKTITTKTLLDHIPEDALLIVAINDHEEFTNTLSNNEFLSRLKTSKSYDQLLKKVTFLKYLQPESEGVLALLEIAKNEYEFFYVTKNNSNLIVNDSIQELPSEAQINTSIKAYSVDDISFFTVIVNQKLIVSSSELLLKNLNNQNPLASYSLLEKLYSKANKNKAASLFLNSSKGSKLLSSITTVQKNEAIEVPSFSDWISLDINDNKEHLNLSGIGIYNDSINDVMTLFNNTRPLTNTTPQFAPANVDAIWSYTFDNYSTFEKNRKIVSGITAPVEPPMETVEEIGILSMGSEDAIILNTFGSESISEYLMNQKKETYDFQGQEIIVLNKPDFLNIRFSPIVKDFDAKFCVLIDNAFIFSSTNSLLKTIIRDYKNGHTFNKSAIFKSLNQDIAKESSILFLSNSKNIKKTLKDNFSSNFVTEIQQINLSDYGIAAQSIADKNFYHTNVVINKIGSSENGTTSRTAKIFEINLESEIATNPQFVTNHNTGRQEIIVQDQNNVLYLISSKGKIIWKKKLSSLIQGSIEQVDIFKNGRLQLAFTTNNQFMVLDRNGDEVKKFTKTYEGGNLNPLAVFDYNKKKNYRFVITQSDKTFMYDREAKIVKGFKYTKAEQPIIAVPKHLVIGNKDVLVFKLKDGSLKLLNRVGDVRIKVNQKVDFSKNEVYKYKNKFTLTDKKGTLHQIDLKGKLTKSNFNLASDHGMSSTENTLVLMNDNILTIRGKKIELELGVYTKPKIFYINNKIYVSVTDLQNEKVYLYDSQAKPIRDFPLTGFSAIDLADTNKALLLVTKEDNNSLSVYKVN